MCPFLASTDLPPTNNRATAILCEPALVARFRRAGDEVRTRAAKFATRYNRESFLRRRSMETPVILSAVRTPVGKFQGGLASFSAPELGGKIVAEAARRAGIDAKQIDEAILGNVVQAGLGQNPARQAALKGGWDPRVAAMTINKVCGL